MDFISLAKGFAIFLKELGIDDPYVIIMLLAMAVLMIAMWRVMSVTLKSNKETNAANQNTINLLTNHHKICIEQHGECQEGQKSLQAKVDEMNKKFIEFLTSEKGRQPWPTEK